MWEEDNPKELFQHPGEASYFVLVCCLALLTGWVFTYSPLWHNLVLVALMVLPPFLYVHRVKSGSALFPRPWSTFFGIGLPVWAAVGIHVAALATAAVAVETLDGVTHWTPKPQTPTAPASFPGIHGWFHLLAFANLYWVAALLPVMLQSVEAIRKLLLLLVFNAAALAATGFLAWVLAGHGDVTNGAVPFGQFPDKDAWAAFALVWFTAGAGLFVEHIRFEGLRPFLARGGVWKVAALLLLGGSVFFAGTPLHQQWLWVGFGGVLAHAAVMRTAPGKPQRAWRFGVPLVAVALGVVGFGGFATVSSPLAWQVPSEQVRISEAATQRAREAVAVEVGQRPVFGWGVGNFRGVAAMSEDPQLWQMRSLPPLPSLTRYRFEHGWFGVAIAGAVILVTLALFLRQRMRLTSSYSLLWAGGVGVIAGFFGVGWEHPAVTLSLWLLLFAALRLSSIPMPRAPKVERPNVVFSPEEMAMLPRVAKALEDRPRSPRPPRQQPGPPPEHLPPPLMPGPYMPTPTMGPDAFPGADPFLQPQQPPQPPPYPRILPRREPHPEPPKEAPLDGGDEPQARDD